MIAIIPGAMDESKSERARSIEELIRTVSASRLNSWSQCRLKFFFRYVSGIAKQATPALHIGKVVHATLQQWSLARWRGESFDDAAARASFERSWIAQQQEGEIDWKDGEAESKAHAFSLVLTYLKETPIPPDEKPEGVEVGVEADLEAHGLPTFIGILDLVRAGGRIVDYKTTGRTPSTELAPHLHEVQTTGYALLYREATGHRESAVELHHLVKTKLPKLVITETPPVSEGQITRLYRQIESYVDGLLREDFIPSPGLQCASCEFFNECRAWS